MGEKEKYEARKADRKSNEDKQKWWFNQIDPTARLTGWLVAFTCLLSIATVFTGVILIITDHTLKDTLALGRSEQRAWIAPRLPEITSNIERGQTLEYDRIYENIGKQPALNIVHIQEHGLFPVELDLRKTAYWSKGIPIPQNKTCPQPFPGSIITQANEQSAFFGQPIRTPSYLFTDADKGISEEFINRKVTFFVQGCIIYYTLGKPHFSTYCAYLYPSNEPAQRWKFRFCPNGNYTDEYEPYSNGNFLHQVIINNPK